MWKSVFKIIEVRNGFAIWKRKNVGGGFAYEDTGRRFGTLEEAMKYVEQEKEGEKK